MAKGKTWAVGSSRKSKPLEQVAHILVPRRCGAWRLPVISKTPSFSPLSISQTGFRASAGSPARPILIGAAADRHRPASAARCRRPLPDILHVRKSSETVSTWQPRFSKIGSAASQSAMIPGSKGSLPSRSPSQPMRNPRYVPIERGGEFRAVAVEAERLARIRKPACTASKLRHPPDRRHCAPSGPFTAHAGQEDILGIGGNAPETGPQAIRRC